MAVETENTRSPTGGSLKAFPVVLRLAAIANALGRLTPDADPAALFSTCFLSTAPVPKKDWEPGGGSVAYARVAIYELTVTGSFNLWSHRSSFEHNLQDAREMLHR